MCGRSDECARRIVELQPAAPCPAGLHQLQRKGLPHHGDERERVEVSEVDCSLLGNPAGKQAVFVGVRDAGEVQVVGAKPTRCCSSVLDQHGEGSRLHGVVCDIGDDETDVCSNERP